MLQDEKAPTHALYMREAAADGEVGVCGTDIVEEPDVETSELPDADREARPGEGAVPGRVVVDV